jgi:hypothetical protein
MQNLHDDQYEESSYDGGSFCVRILQVENRWTGFDWNIHVLYATGGDSISILISYNPK